MEKVIGLGSNAENRHNGVGNGEEDEQAKAREANDDQPLKQTVVSSPKPREQVL